MECREYFSRPLSISRTHFSCTCKCMLYSQWYLQFANLRQVFIVHNNLYQQKNSKIILCIYLQSFFLNIFLDYFLPQLCIIARVESVDDDVQTFRRLEL